MSLSAPEVLTALHDVSSFDCGRPNLNVWLQRHALKNQQAGAARTVVVCSGQAVIGYYALSAGTVVHAEATGKVRRNMPDPVPMALLGRLAVDRSAQGTGVGAGMLQDAMMRVWQASALLGVRGIVVDALDDGAARFYQRFGFRPSAALPLKLMITLDEVGHILGQTNP
jgi:predicted N-acetyltransferase YhbS